jgi:hypothetical protein
MKHFLCFAVSSLALGCGSSSSGPDGASPDGGTDAQTADAANDADTVDGATDTGTGGDSGPMPIVAPADTWTWIPIDGAVCGNGSPTGIGINPHAGATHLLFYMQGGGACYDGPTCFGTSPTASYMNGYGANDFKSELTVLALPFARSNMGNPFKDADYVFVPYCTGDLHAGATIANYMLNGKPIQAYHHGGHNVDLALARLAATFTTLDRVWVLGASAGGFATVLNQDFAARAFGGIRVDVIDDSGPPIDFGFSDLPTPWGVRLPAGCTGCDSTHKVFLFDRATYPMSRYALLTYQTDTTLPNFYMESQQKFAMQIASFITSLGPDKNAKAFEALSSGHVVLAEGDATAVPYILPWFTKMATDDPTWANEQH